MSLEFPHNTPVGPIQGKAFELRPSAPETPTDHLRAAIKHLANDQFNEAHSAISCLNPEKDTGFFTGLKSRMVKSKISKIISNIKQDLASLKPGDSEEARTLVGHYADILSNKLKTPSLSPAQQNEVIKVLKLLNNTAIKFGLIVENPEAPILSLQEKPNYRAITAINLSNTGGIGVGFAEAPDQTTFVFKPVANLATIALGDHIQNSLGVPTIPTRYISSTAPEISEALNVIIPMLDVKMSDIQARKKELQSSEYGTELRALDAEEGRLLKFTFLLKEKIPLMLMPNERSTLFSDFKKEHPEEAYELAKQPQFQKDLGHMIAGDCLTDNGDRFLSGNNTTNYMVSSEGRIIAFDNSGNINPKTIDSILNSIKQFAIKPTLTEERLRGLKLNLSDEDIGHIRDYMLDGIRTFVLQVKSAGGPQGYIENLKKIYSHITNIESNVELGSLTKLIDFCEKNGLG